MTLTSAIQEVAADQRESDPEITTRDAVEHVRATIGVDQVQDDADNAAAYRMVLAATDAEILDALGLAEAGEAEHDHSMCSSAAHTRVAPENTRQIGDDESDGQLVDANGKILCNGCQAPLVWCETHEDYFHLDPTTPPCFLVSEALPFETKDV